MNFGFLAPLILAAVQWLPPMQIGWTTAFGIWAMVPVLSMICSSMLSSTGTNWWWWAAISTISSPLFSFLGRIPSGTYNTNVRDITCTYTYCQEFVSFIHKLLALHLSHKWSRNLSTIIDTTTHEHNVHAECATPPSHWNPSGKNQC